MNILADVRLLSRGGTSGIEEYTRNLLRELLMIDKSNEYSLFYNGLRKKPLEIATPSTTARGRAGLAMTKEEIAASLNDKIVDWHIPNKILDAGVRFLGFPAIDNFVKADLVFSPHFNILKTARAPRVITFHDLSFLHHPYFFSGKQKFWHWLQDVKRQAREAAKIIAVSEFTKSDLVNLLGVPPEKIEAVYSGISSEFRKIAASRTPRNDEEIRPYFLYLGTLEPRKNVPAIIRAFNILKSSAAFADWQLVIAGRPGWIHRSIDREAARSPFHEDIVFTGSVKPEERVSLYNSAKAFVYPSFFEGFGFPPLEAQASGCPVIASDRTSLPEVLADSALLVNPWRVEDLALAMREVALNESLRDRLIKSGLQNAARYTWKNAARETLRIFNSL